jgi:hypothetical protein
MIIKRQPVTFGISARSVAAAIFWMSSSEIRGGGKSGPKLIGMEGRTRLKGNRAVADRGAENRPSAFPFLAKLRRLGLGGCLIWKGHGLAILILDELYLLAHVRTKDGHLDAPGLRLGPVRVVNQLADGLG